MAEIIKPAATVCVGRFSVGKIIGPAAAGSVGPVPPALFRRPCSAGLADALPDYNTTRVRLSLIYKLKEIIIQQVTFVVSAPIVWGTIDNL